MSTRNRKKAVSHKYHLNPPDLKLGKRAPEVDDRTLKLAKYLVGDLPDVPTRNGYIDKLTSLPMFLNDELGCCVISAAGHMIQQWTAYSGKETILTDHEILEAYEYIGGYKPGHPETDNGVSMLSALKFWRRHGIGKHRIKAFVQVDHTNQNQVSAAITLFGNLMVGLQLPLRAQDPNAAPDGTPLWSYPPGGLIGNGSVGGWGGHCVPLLGYNADAGPEAPRGTKLISWAKFYDMTPKFHRGYGDESYAVVTQDWLNAQSDSPSGLHLDQLLNDLAAIPSLPAPE